MKTSLNFAWHFVRGFHPSYLTKKPEAAYKVDLPHNMVDFPFNYYDQTIFSGEGTYFKDISLKDLKPNQTVILKFEGVNNSFTLFVNEAEVGTYTRAYMEEKIDITSFVREGTNKLVVKVSGSETTNAPPFGHTVDYFTFPGIYREISLYVYDEVYLDNLMIDARANGAITLRPVISNKYNVAYTLTFKVLNNTQIVSESANHAFKVTKPRLWSLNDPYLYTLVATLKHDNNSETYTYSFGFRDFNFTATSFSLNGTTMPLVGLNRHETFPYIGGAAPESLQFADVKALKALGVNYVRCSHYPPSRHFLAACDELGLLVINEVPGWQHIGDESWQALHLHNIETMITRDYNHPSIIAWSVRINESVDHDDLYTKSHAIAKALDPYRPTTGTRNFEHSSPLEDLYSYNDFSHDGTNLGLLPKKKVTKTTKPYIVSENNGHMFPTKPFDNPQILLSHAKRHLAVLDAYFAAPDVVAISPWCMHDYYTHKEFGSGDKICYHGVLDINRTPKLAAYVYMSNFSPKPVLMPAFYGDNGDLPESRLYETMVFSNAATLKLYRGDNFIKTYYPRRDLYKNLPHPPFVLDTFISEDFPSKLNFKAKDRKVIAKLLNFAALHNFNRLSIGNKLRLLRLLLKYKLKREDLVELWSTNVAGWGQQSSDFSIIAYDHDGTEMARTPLRQTTTTTYEYTLTNDVLENRETYDVTTLVITSLSPYRNTYDFSPLTITTKGPITLLGPPTQNLHAGSTTLLFRSQSGTGSATIEVKLHGSIKSFNVTVK